MDIINKYRVADYEIDKMFLERWSIKSFLDKSLSKDQISKLFEAARWAPSSSNRQPWRFIYSSTGVNREKMNSILNDGNRSWASKAPLLVFVYAMVETKEGKNNYTAQFDTGAAWMSLAIQARIMGLYTHAMGGIDREKALNLINSNKHKFQSICAIAVGYIDESEFEDNPEEIPNQRISINNFSEQL